MRIIEREEGIRVIRVNIGIEQIELFIIYVTEIQIRRKG
jgi:hypothetical protein